MILHSLLVGNAFLFLFVLFLNSSAASLAILGI